MEIRSASPRLAILAADPARGELLASACRTALPDALVELVRDMVDLMIRAAAGATDVAVVDGSIGASLPAEGVTVLKGLRSTLHVVIVDARPDRFAEHRVEQVLDDAQLQAWLEQGFPRKAR